MGTLEQLAGGAPKQEPSPRAPQAKDSSPLRVIRYDARYDDKASLFLPWLWGCLKDEGLLELYNLNPETDFAQFARILSGDANVLLIITNDDPPKCVGLATWSPMTGGQVNSALGGFLFFKEFWNHHTTDTAGREVLRYWFETEKLDVMIGSTPELNRPALQYILRLGFTRVGTIPMMGLLKGRVCGAVISHMTREQFGTLYGGGA